MEKSNYITKEYLKSTLDERFGSFEVRQGKRLSAFENRLEKRFDKKLDKRLSSFEDRLDKKFDKKLDDKFDAWDIKIRQYMKDLTSGYNEKLKGMGDYVFSIDERVTKIEQGR